MITDRCIGCVWRALDGGSNVQLRCDDVRDDFAYGVGGFRHLSAAAGWIMNGVNDLLGTAAIFSASLTTSMEHPLFLF